MLTSATVCLFSCGNCVAYIEICHNITESNTNDTPNWLAAETAAEAFKHIFSVTLFKGP